MKTFSHRLFSCFLILTICLTLTGCGDGLSGNTYTGEGTMSIIDKIEFKSGGKVYATGMGQTKEGTYTVDGDKVSVTIAGDNAVFTKNSDGTLAGPMGMKLKKQ